MEVITRLIDIGISANYLYRSWSKQKIRCYAWNRRGVETEDLPGTYIYASYLKGFLTRIQLEDALEAASQEPPAKRAKTTASAGASASAGPSAASSKAEEKKRKMQLKKIFDR